LIDRGNVVGRLGLRGGERVRHDGGRMSVCGDSDSADLRAVSPLTKIVCQVLDQTCRQHSVQNLRFSS
jgi:hypothetical protein